MQYMWVGEKGCRRSENGKGGGKDIEQISKKEGRWIGRTKRKSIKLHKHKVLKGEEISVKRNTWPQGRIQIFFCNCVTLH